MIEEHDVDYYTAVYSARVKDFEQHFDTLRGSRDEYFTPSDRALLTYELLSRADCDDHPDEKMRTPRPQFNNYAEGKGRENKEKHTYCICARNSSFKKQWFL